MLTRLILKELRAHVLTARFQAVLVLQVVTLAAGFGLMTESYQARREAFYSSREIDRQENEHAFRVMNSTEAAEHRLADILLLCLWCALFLVAGYAVFSRGDVT
jgi:hypothetical protein